MVQESEDSDDKDDEDDEDSSDLDYDSDGEVPLRPKPPALRITEKAIGKRPVKPRLVHESDSDSEVEQATRKTKGQMKAKGKAKAPAAEESDDVSSEDAPQQGRTTRHSTFASSIGKAVDVKLQNGNMARGELLKAEMRNGQEFLTYEEDTTGDRVAVNARYVSLAHKLYQTTPPGLRPRDLASFVSGRGSVLFSENLTFAKKTGPQTAGMPFAIIHTSETGFQGFGTMGDVASSETTFVFSELPVHTVTDDDTLGNCQIGDLLCFPDASSVAAKVTKTSARASVTGNITGDCFEIWGGAVPALEVKDRLMPKETEFILAKVAQFGRPGQEQWLDYPKVGGSKRVGEKEMPQLFFISPRDLPEEGIYHLRLTTDLRIKYFGQEWEARHSQALRLSSFLAPARSMQLLPTGKPLDTFFGVHDVTVHCNLLLLGGVKKISSMIVDGYDRVGGLNVKVHAAALDKYQEACARLVRLITNILGMPAATVQWIANERIVEFTPKLAKRAEQRGQGAADSGATMAGTKLPPKDGKNGEVTCAICPSTAPAPLPYLCHTAQ